MIIMKKLFLYSFLAGGLAFGLSSCLKDDEHFTNFQNVGAVAEIPSSAFYGIEDNQGIPIQTTPTTYSFDVNIASPTPPSQDVTVTLAIDKAALDAYNAADTTRHYQLLPTSLYQISGLTTTVKAGSRLAPVQLSFFSSTDKVPNPTAYNDAEYALPLKITSASNNVAVSSNYGTKIIFVKIKNQYDAAYHAVGVFTHPTAGARKIDREKNLVTVDLTTVQTEYADLGGNGYSMWLRVNADNTVTIIPKGSTPATSSQIGVNKYDPATHTFTLNYQYPGAGGNRVITETLTRE